MYFDLQTDNGVFLLINHLDNNSKKDESYYQALKVLCHKNKNNINKPYFYQDKIQQDIKLIPEADEISLKIIYPLEIAIKNQDIKSCQILKEHGAKFYLANKCFLNLAVKIGQKNIIQFVYQSIDQDKKIHSLKSSLMTLAQLKMSKKPQASVLFDFIDDLSGLAKEQVFDGEIGSYAKQTGLLGYYELGLLLAQRYCKDDFPEYLVSFMLHSFKRHIHKHEFVALLNAYKQFYKADYLQQIKLLVTSQTEPIFTEDILMSLTAIWNSCKENLEYNIMYVIGYFEIIAYMANQAGNQLESVLESLLHVQNKTFLNCQIQDKKAFIYAMSVLKIIGNIEHEQSKFSQVIVSAILMEKLTYGMQHGADYLAADLPLESLKQLNYKFIYYSTQGSDENAAMMTRAANFVKKMLKGLRFNVANEHDKLKVSQAEEYCENTRLNRLLYCLNHENPNNFKYDFVAGCSDLLAARVDNEAILNIAIKNQCYKIFDRIGENLIVNSIMCFNANEKRASVLSNLFKYLIVEKTRLESILILFKLLARFRQLYLSQPVLDIYRSRSEILYNYIEFLLNSEQHRDLISNQELITFAINMSTNSAIMSLFKPKETGKLYTLILSRLIDGLLSANSDKEKNDHAIGIWAILKDLRLFDFSDDALRKLESVNYLLLKRYQFFIKKYQKDYPNIYEQFDFGRYLIDADEKYIHGYLLRSLLKLGTPHLMNKDEAIFIANSIINKDVVYTAIHASIKKERQIVCNLLFVLLKHTEKQDCANCIINLLLVYKNKTDLTSVFDTHQFDIATIENLQKAMPRFLYQYRGNLTWAQIIDAAQSDSTSIGFVLGYQSCEMTMMTYSQALLLAKAMLQLEPVIIGKCYDLFNSVLEIFLENYDSELTNKEQLSISILMLLTLLQEKNIIQTSVLNKINDNKVEILSYYGSFIARYTYAKEKNSIIKYLSDDLSLETMPIDDLIKITEILANKGGLYCLFGSKENTKSVLINTVAERLLKSNQASISKPLNILVLAEDKYDYSDKVCQLIAEKRAQIKNAYVDFMREYKGKFSIKALILIAMDGQSALSKSLWGNNIQMSDEEKIAQLLFSSNSEHKEVYLSAMINNNKLTYIFKKFPKLIDKMLVYLSKKEDNMTVAEACNLLSALSESVSASEKVRLSQPVHNIITSTSNLYERVKSIVITRNDDETIKQANIQHQKLEQDIFTL